MARDWVSEMRLYLKRCSNLDSLSCADQKTMSKRFVEKSLWREINVARSENWIAIINKVEEAFTTIVPSLVRKDLDLDLKVHQGEGAIEWTSRIDDEPDVAYLKKIKSQDIKIKKKAKDEDVGAARGPQGTG